jgi:hypothetical protein
MNLALAAENAGGVWFDEYHHGYREAAPAVVEPLGVVTCVGVALLAAFLFIVSKGARFGPVRPPLRYNRRSAMEFVRSAAGLYRRAAARQWAAQTLLRSLSRRLARTGGLVEVASASGAGGFRGAHAAAVTALARRAGAVSKDSDLLDLAREMDSLERDIIGG